MSYDCQPSYLCASGGLGVLLRDRLTHLACGVDPSDSSLDQWLCTKLLNHENFLSNFLHGLSSWAPVLGSHKTFIQSVHHVADDDAGHLLTSLGLMRSAFLL